MQALQSRPEVADRHRMLRLADEQVQFNDFEREEKVARYRRLLARADWFHEASDNHEVWREGRAQFTAIYELQVEVDPDGSIWRTVAPAAMTSGVSIPQPRARRSA
ncbi:hypothetical protein [Variovorax paradoxus]|uniref:hypothetical protein n=1 Tax=Variovorax paradoxus TaxID=34073 RepID=UPI0019346395|nr:hypothetical protein INQ48_18155 [Variovorax paradoxus]